MKRFLWVSCTLGALLMASCGSKSTNTASIGSGQPSGPAPTGPATADQVAKEMRGNVKCPASASTARPAGAPVDDVTGVRPGMGWGEAASFVMCDNPLMVVTEDTSRTFNINTYGQHLRQGFDAQFAKPRVVQTSQQILQGMEQDAMQRGSNTYVAPLQPGQSRYYVSTMGLPGQEQVITVAREEYFPDGKLPTVDSLKQALVAKYGDPTLLNDNGSNVSIWWEYDPSGAKIAGNAPLASACRINVSPDAGTSLSTNCGLTVGALVQGAPNNPGLAHSLAVSSQNGAQGMAVLSATEQSLQQADQARKANELNNASKNAKAPTL